MGDYRKSRVSILTRVDVIRPKSVFLVTKLRQLSSLRSKHFHRVRAKGFPYVRRSFPLFGLMYQSIPSAIIPPPRGNPRAFDPCSAPYSGAFDANRSPTHRAIDRSKKCWSSVAYKKDFLLHVTSHNSSWFSTKFMLIYAISSILKYSEIRHYRRFGIFRRT